MTPAAPPAAPGAAADDGTVGAAFGRAAARHRGGDLHGAETAYREILRVRPRHAPSLHHLGLIAAQVGRMDVARDLIARSLVHDPACVDARNNLGNALHELGALGAAQRAFAAAAALDPARPEAYANLARTALLTGRPGVSATASRRALALAPDLAAAHNNLGNALKEQGRHAEAAAAFRAALDRAPDFAEAASNLLLSLNYARDVDEAALAGAHRAWGRRHGPPPAAAPPAHPRDPNRTLRVGYVSADFGRHPVGYFLADVLAAHDRTRVLPVCYSVTPYEDDLTRRIMAATLWRPALGLDDAALAAAIRREGIDILVDLSGHTAGNRLGVFARRAAPVQASWIGYVHTTGLAAMDYILMDEATVPPGTEGLFVERVLRLPGGRFCYAPPGYAPPVVARPAGPVVFGSFNNLAKVTSEVVALWAEVLHAVPGSRLVLKWPSLADDAERARLAGGFAAHGVAPARLDLRAASPHPAMLAEYGDIDVALDPFPFSGGLTSVEALWMGVPVVTWPQDRPASRQTLAILRTVGLSELAVDGRAAYVALAARLAADADRRARLRAGLRARVAASPLCDAPGFTRGLEAAFASMWLERCGVGAGGAP